MTRKTPQGLTAICFYLFPALVTLPTMFYHTLIHHTFLLFHQCFSSPGQLTHQVSESERPSLASLHPAALPGKAGSPRLLMTCYFSALHLFFIVAHSWGRYWMPFLLLAWAQGKELHSILFTAVSPVLDKSLANVGLQLIMNVWIFRQLNKID